MSSLTQPQTSVLETRLIINVSSLDRVTEFLIHLSHMPTPEQKRRLLKAKIACALRDELGRVPTSSEIDRVFLLTRVMYKAVLGLHFKRKEQKEKGQLAIF